MGTKTKDSGTKGGLAAKIIAAAKQHCAATLPESALAELREIVKYNDSEVVGHGGRAGAGRVCSMLEENFGWKGGRAALDAVCRRQLGRKSFSEKGGTK